MKSISYGLNKTASHHPGAERDNIHGYIIWYEWAPHLCPISGYHDPYMRSQQLVALYDGDGII